MPHRLSYPFADRLPRDGELLAVAPGIHWLRLPLPLALDHINLWLLDDGPDWSLVDTGYGDEPSRARWQTLCEGSLARRRLRRLVLTHSHPDHIGQADWLCRRFEVSCHCSLGEYLSALAVWHELPGFDAVAYDRHVARHGLDQTSRNHYLQRGNLYRQNVPALPAHFSRIVDGDCLSIDGHSWQALAGFGHSPEHMAFYCAERRVLIAGDMLLPKISTNVGVWASDSDGDPLARFLDSLERMAALPEDTLVLPSHGRPFRGIAARVEALQRHHDERLALLWDACCEPRHAFELIPLLFGREFDPYQTYFALAECIAHLNHLWHCGALQREAGSDGVLRYGQNGSGR
ncbi:MBL fold metallo-hydrolase [Chitinimonas lacunae]|uniref:MBL fold metallo-hydrolase n=1 Tax=Chitinimonas lacunae TaxID=1963018 RepID=A0ABV8MVZ9_9NEIS